MRLQLGLQILTYPQDFVPPENALPPTGGAGWCRATAQLVMIYRLVATYGVDRYLVYKLSMKVQNTVTSTRVR